MSDTISIDLSGVYRALSNVNDNINHNLNILDNHIKAVDQSVENTRRQTMQEINYLKAQFVEMQRQQKLQAALQRAITEVIRVRQELEQRFGTHKLVRDNMLGILQATDLGLITKTTISKCTEELMISAPKYWLAPALVALAAWISDNKNLAERAVKEAVKRDEEKTCLLFALITRRVNAGRVAAGKKPSNTCFLWLDRYFRLQNPFKMRTSIIAYVDAYANGVFGLDKDHICQDHINNWMATLSKQNPDFAEEQKRYWLHFFGERVQHMNTEQFACLQRICPQYNAIDNYLSRIGASEDEGHGIKSYIRGIEEQEADREKLVHDIDEQLMNLVSKYEEDEAPLRDEEEYLDYVKKYNGDEDKARNMVNAIHASKKDDPVDFAQRLSESITTDNATVSAKKTALSMLKGYIGTAFNEFITEYKDSYPETIDLEIKEPANVANGKPFTWNGQTTNGENRDELVSSLKKQYDSERKAAIDRVSDEQALKDKKTAKICFCLSFLIIPLFIGISKNKKANAALKANATTRTNIKNYYTNNENKAVDTLSKALTAREEANSYVEQFQKQDNAENIQF